MFTSGVIQLNADREMRSPRRITDRSFRICPIVSYVKYFFAQVAEISGVVNEKYRTPHCTLTYITVYNYLMIVQ